IGTLQFVAIQAPNMQWQPYFAQFFKGGISSFGFLSAGIGLSLMAGAWLAPRLLKKIPDERRALVFMQAIVGIGLAASVAWNVFPVVLTAFLFHEVARGMFKPLKDVYLHDNIPSKERATIVSFESIAHHGGGMIGLLGSGILAEKAGIPVAWALSGMLLLVSALLVMRNGSRKK
ncbi:MAG: MFS transporter, partial [Patescibacteria group bacterium]